MSMRTDDFDYNLPEELIAQAPAEPRDSCRLLVVDRKGSQAGKPLEHGGTVDTRSGRRPNQSERRKIQMDTPTGLASANHDIDVKILHGTVKHFFD